MAERERGEFLKPVYIGGTVNVAISIFTLAVSAFWLWVLDIIGIDVWIAHRIGHFIGLVAEAI